MRIPATDPLAAAVRHAITAGELHALESLLSDNPELATSTLISPCPAGWEERSLLHVATDWPGHYPEGPSTVRTLVAHGADVNARFIGRHSETPLHWAASSDDVAVLDALLDLGADLEAEGGVIGGGTPIADAVAFGQWQAARRLLQRGARTNLWQAAALGLLDRVSAAFENGGSPPEDEITSAFWCACHGGQLETAKYLLQRGAVLDWIGYDGLTPLDAAQRSNADAVVQWLRTKPGTNAATPR